jgi:hypothetical protein
MPRSSRVRRPRPPSVGNPVRFATKMRLRHLLTTTVGCIPFFWRGEWPRPVGRRDWESRGHALLGHHAGSRARGPRRDGGAYSFPHADPGGQLARVDCRRCDVDNRPVRNVRLLRSSRNRWMTTRRVGVVLILMVLWLSPPHRLPSNVPRGYPNFTSSPL